MKLSEKEQKIWYENWLKTYHPEIVEFEKAKEKEIAEAQKQRELEVQKLNEKRKEAYKYYWSNETPPEELKELVKEIEYFEDKMNDFAERN